jgi:hypothetical protein
MLLALLVALAPGQTPEDHSAEEAYRRLIQRLESENLRETYRAFERFGSRLAGSSGEAAAFDYLEDRLRKAGLANVRRQPFSVTVPDPDAVGTLSLASGSSAVLPLWPNLAQSSTCDVEGPLIYAGKGRLADLSGEGVRGAIVLMEFDSGSNWRQAAKLGAAAIVFVDSVRSGRADAEAKFAAVPLDVPRFYLPLAEAGPALAAAARRERARLACRQDWVVRTSYNLFADLPGSDPAARGERILVSTYVDAMSVVPGMAPGAETVGGVAVLLEMARVWRDLPNRRPATFMFSGGHGLALQGAREYVDGLIRNGEAAPLLALTLDITSGSRTVGAYGRGWFYEYRGETQMHMQSLSRLFRSHAERLARLRGIAPARLVLADAVNQADGRTWKNNIPGKFALDCEPMLLAGMNALTFVTVEDARARVDTPRDRFDGVDFANVLAQAETVGAMLHHALNDTSRRGVATEHRLPLETRSPRRMTLTGGFAVAEGRVVAYDPATSFVPDVSIPGALATALGRQRTMMGVRGDILQMTRGQEAAYRLVGLPPVSAYFRTDVSPTRLSAFRLDPETGKIDHAPSYGVYGAFSYPIDFRLTTAVRRSPIVVFPCVPVALYDLVDPQELRALAYIDVMDADSGAPPQDFGVFGSTVDMRLGPEVEDAQVIFLRQGQRFLLLGASAMGEHRLILTNSSVGDEAGIGYIAPGGEPGVASRQNLALGGFLPFVALNAAKDIVAINETRLRRFEPYRILGGGIVRLHEDAKAEIELAEAALAARDWVAADQHSRAAWGLALRAHPVIQGTANDVVNGVVFYLFLLIPFSYFAERLLVGNRLLTRQIAWTVGIFIGTFALLRLIHPAFEIISNPMMIFVAFVMGALSILVITFILGKFESSLRVIKREKSGLVEIDVRRSSVAMAAFNLGVGNMRRRKARTFLTTLTLVVMTFIVLSFTSIVAELQLNELPSDNPARYSGLLLRNPGMEPMQLATYRQVQNEFQGRGTIVRRATYYGADIGDAGILTLSRADRIADARAVLGLDAEEARVMRPQEALLPGGRWFAPGERDVAILPKPLADALRIDPAEVGRTQIEFAGVEYTVVGIVDAAILRGLLDLDGDAVLPPDFTLSRRFQEESATGNQAFRSFIRLDPASVLILPVETTLGMGADLRSLAVAFDRPEETRRALDDLMPRLRLNLYASVLRSPPPALPGPHEGVHQETRGLTAEDATPFVADPSALEVRQFSVFHAAKGTGIGLIVVQLLIASVFVLNTMIASVYERTKEIGIFSAIGLGPNHIAMLFFAESLVYGVLGTVVGYILAQGAAKVIVTTGLLPALTLNFSSLAAVMSAGMVMAVVLASTIYPARQAARIAAPAMNDEVFESEPEGDAWQIPLPFSVGEREAGPLMAFLAEWLKAYEEYTIGEFVTSGTAFALENGAYRIETLAWLAPYDLGISQRIVLTAQPGRVPGIYLLDLDLRREGGDPENWPVVNRRFLEALRRQFLTWRTLESERRRRYEEQAEALASD